MNRSHELSGESVTTLQAAAALGAMVESECAEGRLGGPWTHELTPVVKHCGVVVCDCRPVLQVNPTWLQELVTRDELTVLADEMRTWFEIRSAALAQGAKPDDPGERRGTKSLRRSQEARPAA